MYCLGTNGSVNVSIISNSLKYMEKRSGISELSAILLLVSTVEECPVK